MKFVLINEDRAPLSARRLKTRAGRVWREIAAAVPKSVSRRAGAARSVVLAFAGAAEMKRLNAQFRGKKYATDVLSFAPTEAGSLGELVFCVEVLERQAREHGLSFEEEFTYMLIHGLLHLLGYDHERGAAEARRMFKIQDAVFAKF